MGELGDKLRRHALGESLAPEPQVKDEGFEEIRKARREGIRERVYLEALGIDTGDRRRKELAPTPQSPSDVIRLDVGDLLKSQAQTTQALLSQVTSLQKDKPSDPFLTFIMNELKDVKSKLDESRGGNPIQELMEAQEVLDTLAAKMAKRAGVPEGVPVHGNDMGLLLQREQVVYDREEAHRRYLSEKETRDRQWAIEDEERRRQWEKEDRRWQEEFSLKKAEFEENKANKGRLAEGLETLFAGFSESLERGSDGSTGRPGRLMAERIPEDDGAGPQGSPQDAHGFKCEKCQGVVVVPDRSQSGDTVTCRSCQSKYRLIPEPQDAVQ